MSKLTALDVLGRFEAHLGDLYDLFAEVLHDDPDVATVFAQLALDEYSHARQVAYQRRLLDEDPKLFGEIDVDEAELYRETAHVKTVRDHARSLSAAEATAQAIEFETSASDYHSRMALRQANQEFAGFLAYLGRADDDHRARLEDLIPLVMGGRRTPSPV